MRRSKQSRLTRLVRRRDERGATFVFTALCMVLLFWGGAMGVNIGFNVLGTRDAQAAADTASLDMARYINLADHVSGFTNANNYLKTELTNIESDNGWGSAATVTYTGGYWNATGAPGWSVPTKGANPGCYSQLPQLNPACTAVKVTVSQKVPQIFFGGTASVSRSAIAAVTPEDGFSVGGYLSSFNSQQSGVLNAILSALGTSATVSAAGYQGLANTYVSIQQLITASGGALTTSNVLTTSLSAAQWLSILTAAVNTQQGALSCSATPVPSPCAAYTALQSLTFGSSPVKLCQLVSINGSTCGGSVSENGLSTNLDVLQTLTTEAELANGSNALNVQSALGITGVTSSTLSLDLIQPPQIAYGAVGVTATTAEVSADLQLNVAGVGLIDIPLSAAEGTGTLGGITCSQANNSFTQAYVNVSTQTSSAAITLNGAALTTLTVSGASGQATFPSAVVPPTASTQSAVPSTNPIQTGTTSPTLSYSPTPGSGVVGTLLTSTLYGVLSPVLQAAGVSVGGTDTADLNYNCGAVSIVQ